MTLAKPTNGKKKILEKNPSFIQYHLNGIAEALKEIDPKIDVKKFGLGSIGSIFTVKTNSNKVFYFEEDNKEVTFTYDYQKKTNKKKGITIYCTFRLEVNYVFKEYDGVGKSIAEKYIDNMNKYMPKFEEMIKEGEKLISEIENPENDDNYIYIYANIDAETAILRVGDKRITYSI